MPAGAAAGLARGPRSTPPGVPPPLSARPPRSTPPAPPPPGRSDLNAPRTRGARHAAALHDLVEHHLGGRYRNGEADAHRAARAREDRGIDADEIARGVDQRAAGIARVDGGIGLDEVLEGVDAQARAPERRDDAAGDRLPDAKWIADGEHHVADAQGYRRAQADSPQTLRPYPPHSWVRLWI